MLQALNLVFFFLAIHLFAGPVSANRIHCSDLFIESASSYTYLDKGATGLVFQRGTEVFKVPINPRASNYEFNNGFKAATHEAMLLSTFHRLIEKAGVTEFRPLTHVKAKTLDDPQLIDLVSETTRHLNPREGEGAIVDGVLVSEFVQGRTLGQVLMDPSVPAETSNRHAQNFYNALVKIENFLERDPPDFRISELSGIDKNRVDDFDQGFFIASSGAHFPYSLMIDLLPPRRALQREFLIFLHAGDNIIVDPSGKLVLIDPN